MLQLGMVLFILVLLSKYESYKCTSADSDYMWEDMLRVILTRRLDLKQNLILLIARRINQVTYETLKHILKSDRLEIFNGINIVRYKQNNDSIIILQHHSYNDMTFNNKIMSMLLNIAQKYSLKIYLDTFVKKENLVTKGRHRRRRHHMMPFMIFGIVGLSMILVPMGFKFLAILGGKALLLAKMALMLSSIQGLKKFATSNYNYGLYQTPPVHPWSYDRHGYENIPNTQSEVFPPAYIQS